MGPGTWIAMALMMLVFWALVVGLVVYLIRNVAHPRSEVVQPPTPQASLQILEERFARGEIDAEEYTQRRELLRSG